MLLTRLTGKLAPSQGGRHLSCNGAVTSGRLILLGSTRRSKRGRIAPNCNAAKTTRDWALAMTVSY